MSPVAIKVLSDAYSHYAKTGDTFISYKLMNSEEWLYALEGARQLCQSGLIEPVSTFLQSDYPSSHFPVMAPIEFFIAGAGLQWIEKNRKPEQ